MVERTPVLKLALPMFDQTPWDDDVNNNFRTLDNALGRIFTDPNFYGIWTNSTVYTAGNIVINPDDSHSWLCLVTHTSLTSPATFTDEITAHPDWWQIDNSGSPFYLQTTGGTLTGSVIVDTGSDPNGASFLLDADVGIAVGIASARQGRVRWVFALGDDHLETGGNAGSDIALNAYGDTKGDFLGSVLTVKRATRTVDFNVMPTLNGIPLSGGPSMSLPITGGTLTGTLSISSTATGPSDGAYLGLRSAAGTPNVLFGGRQAAPGTRWALTLGDASAESGGNAGTRFLLTAYKDDGTLLGSVIDVDRNDRVVNFAVMPTINNVSMDTTFVSQTGGTIAGSLVVTGSTKLGTVGFNNSAPISKPTITGARSDATGVGALAGLLSALASYGLIIDSSIE